MQTEHFNSYFYTHTPGALKEELPFTLESIGYKNVSSNTCTYPLTAKMYCAFFCIDGQCIAKTASHNYMIKKNSVICFCPEEEDVLEINAYPDCTYRYIYFHSSSAKYFCKMLNLPCFIQMNESDASAMTIFFDELYENVVFELGNKDISINMTITEIMTFLVKKNQEKILDSFHHQATENYHYRSLNPSGRSIVSQKSRSEINKVLLYIHNQYFSQISIEELSRMIHFNKCYFIKVFRSLVGMSPYEYITNLRINEAKQLLINTSLSISEVSEQVGFLDTNNFIRRFRSRTDMSPLQYRNKYK